MCSRPSGLGGAVATGGGSAIAKASSDPTLEPEVRGAVLPLTTNFWGGWRDKGAARGGSRSGGGGGSGPRAPAAPHSSWLGALRPGLAAG